MARKRPTILQIIPELDTGGAELSTVEIAEAITVSGGRAIVISEGGRLEKQLADVGGEIVRLPAATKNPIRMWKNASDIAKFVRTHGVHLLHARSRAPAWSALRAARLTGIPFVTTYHGAYNERGKLKNIYNSVMARGDVVIANSIYTAKLVQERYGTPEEKIRVIYRGVDPDQYDPDKISAERRDALRANWDVAPDTPIILNAARLTAWKGQRVIIEAVRQLSEQGRLGNAIVILAGDDQGRRGYRQELEKLIASSGLKERVRIVGHVNDIPAALALSHLAIVASIEPEAFGRAATEAQISSCPVIATDIGAPPETVCAEPNYPRRRITGWLVPPSEPDRLADAIVEGLNLSKSDRREMGRRARQHVASSFSLDVMKYQTIQVYDELLGTQLSRNESK